MAFGQITAYSLSRKGPLLGSTFLSRPLSFVQQLTLCLLPHISHAVIIKTWCFNIKMTLPLQLHYCHPWQSCTVTGMRAEGALRWVCRISLSRLPQQTLLSMQATRAHHHDLSLQNRLRAWLHTGGLYLRGHPPQSRAEERTQWQVCHLLSSIITGSSTS